MNQENYNIAYQLSHDIDWFGIHNGVPFHVASNGGFLPDKIKKDSNQQIQTYLARFRSFVSFENIVINNEWLIEQEEHIVRGQFRDIDNEGAYQFHFDKEAYLRSFIEFATKGLVSIDNAIIGDDYVYKIVAYPKRYQDIFKIPKRLEFPQISSQELGGLNINIY